MAQATRLTTLLSGEVEARSLLHHALQGTRPSGSICAWLVTIAFSASAERSHVVLSSESEPSQTCTELMNEVSALRPLAESCQVDADCFHYPCSCSALAAGELSDRYIAILRTLQLECGAAVHYDYCEETRPVCVENRCTTHAMEDAESPPLDGVVQQAGTALTGDVRYLPPDQEQRAYHFVASADQIPPAVIGAFSELCGDCPLFDFRWPLHGASAADPIVRRLLEAGQSAARWALRYQHGGSCVHQHWVVFEIEGGTAVYLGGSFSQSDCGGFLYTHQTCEDSSGRTCEW